ncbi:MAG: hypothetical protein IPN12_03945 [Rhodocyclaceae bacterium]|jgi:uncharacterized membrane protein|nr:hypothetical protein [Rhodocyclaceae bacterium]MBK6554824.1 hypothetical protein [Rhodocyclaceae bacterium]MBK9309897.1 hypothetical protein [Rhodocyclaceae bacterium]
MAAGRNEWLGWLLSGIVLAAWALGFHYLIGIARVGVWLDRLVLAQHVGVNATLGFLFGRTLFAGRRPLVTVLAGLLHENPSPALLVYTRRVTVAWTWFFLALTVLSLLLFFFAPIELWSFFANILTLPLVALMFVVEYVVRKRVLPATERAGFLAAVQAYRSHRAGMRS